MKIIFASSWPAKAMINREGRNTLAKIASSGLVIVITDPDPLASLLHGKMVVMRGTLLPTTN